MKIQLNDGHELEWEELGNIIVVLVISIIFIVFTIIIVLIVIMVNDGR